MEKGSLLLHPPVMTAVATKHRKGHADARRSLEQSSGAVDLRWQADRQEDVKCMLKSSLPTILYQINRVEEVVQRSVPGHAGSGGRECQAGCQPVRILAVLEELQKAWHPAIELKKHGCSRLCSTEKATPLTSSMTVSPPHRMTIRKCPLDSQSL